MTPPDVHYATVDILLSVYDEEAVIASKINNFLELDYPPTRANLLIGLDGCGDGTAEEIRRFSDPRIQTVENSERRGKTAVLNQLVRLASADIVVFTDANAMMMADSLIELVKPFEDPRIGLVSGVSSFEGSTPDSRIRNAYYQMTAWAKTREAKHDGIAGADGAIYAMRRALAGELQPDLINDFSHPIEVVLRGYRSIVTPTAVVSERLDDPSLDVEYHRQVRMTAQALHVVAYYLPTLVRQRQFGYIGVLIRSKVLRWALPILGTVALVSLSVKTIIAPNAVTGWLAFIGWSIILLGVVGIYVRNAWARVFGYALVVAVAYGAGVLKWLVGERFVTWQPRSG